MTVRELNRELHSPIPISSSSHHRSHPSYKRSHQCCPTLKSMEEILQFDYDNQDDIDYSVKAVNAYHPFIQWSFLAHGKESDMDQNKCCTLMQG